MSAKTITVALQNDRVIVHVVPIDVKLDLTVEAAIRLRDDLNTAIWILHPINPDPMDRH